MRRKLCRPSERNGSLDWNDLRQVSLGVQETAEPPKPAHDDERKKSRGRTGPGVDWTVTEEHRFFASNVLWNRLTAAQILRVVRNHWAVENDRLWGQDTQPSEDRPAWCGRGRAVIVLAGLRSLAYNIAEGLRKRHLLEHAAGWLLALAVALALPARPQRRAGPGHRSISFLSRRAPDLSRRGCPNLTRSATPATHQGGAKQTGLGQRHRGRNGQPSPSVRAEYRVQS